MSKRILIVEDDSAMVRLLSDNLRFEGFAVDCCTNGVDAVAMAETLMPNLVLLDLMLPNGEDGLHICESLARAVNRTPVIIITARGEKEDRVRGLTIGADDYLVKPFALEELLARVHAVLRRTKPRLQELRLGETVIDFARLRAYKSGREIAFTPREFDVLRCLADRAGSVVSREDLLRIVWGYADAPLTRTVDNFIFRLRHKIELDPRHPVYLRKSYGDGYQLIID